jgi:thioredoxin reductase (NADPH)
MKGPVDVAVIGAGPAGCAAAVQAVRLGLSVSLVDAAGEAGGLVSGARMVENYPGLGPLPGALLAERLRSFVGSFGIVVIRDRIARVRADGGTLTAEGAEDSIEGRTLVLATGTVPLRAGIDGEEDAEGVYYSIVGMPEPFPGEVVILGGGEAAFDYALSAADRGADTTVLVRGAEPRARGRLRRSAEASGGVRIVYDSTVGRIRSASRSVELEVLTGRLQGRMTAGAVVVAVGRTGTHPDLPGGLLVERCGELRGTGGVFTAGDLRLGGLGQACAAAGQGILAASMALDYIVRGGAGT